MRAMRSSIFAKSSYSMMGGPAASGFVAGASVVTVVGVVVTGVLFSSFMRRPAYQTERPCDKLFEPAEGAAGILQRDWGGAPTLIVIARSVATKQPLAGVRARA